MVKKWPSADDPGAGKPGTGNSATARERSASGCHRLSGRSDYPNQVNNVLCFPFIFRGALDVGATAMTKR
ncbi:hypothetical protein ACNKHM_21100 [Shigella sonnei]